MDEDVRQLRSDRNLAEQRARTAERALDEAQKSRRTFAAKVAAIVLAVVVLGGLFWPGWTFSASAERRADERANAAMKVVAVEILAPLCAATALSDPDTARVAEIKAISSSYTRRNAILETGWLDFENIELSTPNRQALAEECGKLLTESDEPA